MSYCKGNCGFFGGPSGYCSRCAPKLVVTPTTTTAVGNTSTGGTCRLSCGFNGTEKNLWHCSKCFGPIRDDLWMQAVVGAALDMVVPVMQFVSLGGIVNRKLTDDEFSILANKMMVYTSPGWGLADVAFARHSTLVTCYLASLTDEADKDMLIRRTMSAFASSPLQGQTSFQSSPASEDGERSHLVTAVRKWIVDGRSVWPDGLVQLPHLTYPLYTLPKQLRSIPRAELLKELRRFTEAHDVLPRVADAVEFLGSMFVPVYTPGDLNCLLHGTMLSTSAITDSTKSTAKHPELTVLRDAVYTSLVECEALKYLVTGGDDVRLAQLLQDVMEQKSSLEGGHVFVVANILRRPVVVYAPESSEGKHRSELRVPYRMSGIYLPTLSAPMSPLPPPIFLCYTRGHFTGLILVADPGDVVEVPLVDETGVALPIAFGSAEDMPRYVFGYNPANHGCTVSVSPLSEDHVLQTYFGRLRKNILKSVIVTEQ